MPHDDDAAENVPISTSEPHLVGREVVQNGGELTIAAMIAAAMDAGLRGDEEATPKKPDAVGASGPAATHAIVAQPTIAPVKTGRLLEDINDAPTDDCGSGC